MLQLFLMLYNLKHKFWPVIIQNTSKLPVLGAGALDKFNRLNWKVDHQCQKNNLDGNYKTTK